VYLFYIAYLFSYSERRSRLLPPCFSAIERIFLTIKSLRIIEALMSLIGN